MTILQVGDTFTVAGAYRRRTFWQWLTRQPKQLQTYTLTGSYTSNQSATVTIEPPMSGVEIGSPAEWHITNSTWNAQ